MLRWIAMTAALVAGCGLDSHDKQTCETQADCLTGYVCNVGTQTCVPITETPDAPPACIPATCTVGECGAIDDGCGGATTCDVCTGGNVCGGGGVANQCAPRPDHCINGVRDAADGETAIDCGGTCGGCELGEACVAQADCAAGTCQDQVCTAGSWTTAPPMPTARIDLGAATSGGKIYALGGFTQNNGVTGVNEVYDPGTSSWSTRASMPTPRSGFTALVGPDGTIYTVGGQYDSSGSPSVDGPSVKVEAYAPSTNTWSSLPDLPDGRTYGGAAFLNGRIYAYGGISVQPIQLLSSVVSLAPGETTWRAEPRLTIARDVFATAASTSRLYVLGGKNSNGDHLDTVESFQPGDAGWNTMTPISSQRFSLGAAVVGTKLYALGGNSFRDEGTTVSTTVDIYDLVTNTWSSGTRAPVGRDEMATVVGPDGRIYLVGGDTDPTFGTPTNTVAVYTP